MIRLTRLFHPVVSPQKILTMIPTEEEKQRIQEAQLLNPDIPLGSAEQFLLTLSSITELSARLQLWAFKMDYELTEKVRHIYKMMSHCLFVPHFSRRWTFKLKKSIPSFRLLIVINLLICTGQKYEKKSNCNPVLILSFKAMIFFLKHCLR